MRREIRRRGMALLGALVLAMPAMAAVRMDRFTLAAPGVSPTPLRVRVFVPPACMRRAAHCATLYVNDGQDAQAVRLVPALDAFARRHRRAAPVVVAIDAPADRLGAYGFTDRARAQPVLAPTPYGDVGARAPAYADWLVRTLVPQIDARYRTARTPRARAILGWSLGAAQAFDLGSQYPEVFGTVGAFSPSFWLATDRSSPDAIARTRIALARVPGLPPTLRLYLAVGTAEETDDRDGDGVNDALDDVRDVAAAARAAPHAELELVELDGGRHAQASWARVLPGFLHWAYAPRGGRRMPHATAR